MDSFVTGILFQVFKNYLMLFAFWTYKSFTNSSFNSSTNSFHCYVNWFKSLLLTNWNLFVIKKFNVYNDELACKCQCCWVYVWWYIEMSFACSNAMTVQFSWYPCLKRSHHIHSSRLFWFLIFNFSICSVILNSFNFKFTWLNVSIIGLN